MASYVNKVGANYYEIELEDTGTPEFKLNVGSNGKVTITGDLDVLGDSTSIGSSELIVDDNTITVNNGETGSGVSLGTAGIIVDRGTRPNAEMFLVEALDTIRADTRVQGAIAFREETSEDLIGIYTSSIKVKNQPDNLYLLSGDPTDPPSTWSTGLVTVAYTYNYEENIWPRVVPGADIGSDPGQPDNLTAPNDYDALVNVQGLLDYVKAYNTYNFQTKIEDGSLSVTKVEVVDFETSGQPSKISLTVDNIETAAVYEDRLVVESLVFGGNVAGTSIYTGDVNGTLVLQGDSTGTGTGSVQINDKMNFLTKAEPAAPSDGVTIYGNTLGDGGTGLFFVNTDGTKDEFVSRNKALLYSIIF
jgi:hypothetical protein